MKQIKRNPVRRWTVAAAALLLMSTAGCFPGSEGGPELEKVSGVVTLNGQPLAGVHILFEPETDLGPSWGKTDAEGKFTVYYAQRQGAVVGKHRVQFEQTESSEEDAGLSQLTIPKKYAIGSPGIEVEVGAGPNEFQFDLTGKK